MNFIKKIWQNKPDELVHLQFRRFGKGTFENRALINISVGSKIKIKTTFEFSNDFVRFLANTIKGKVKVEGGIITTRDIEKEISKFLNVKKVKKFGGVNTYLVEGEVTKESLLNLLNKFPDLLYCLSFSTDYGELKISVKPPTSVGKITKGGKVKADYCTFTTKHLEFAKEFAFDVKEPFKKFIASHTFVIKEIIIPKEYQKDFEKARIYAKRKGKIIRNIEIDGKELKVEKDFLA